MAVSVSFLQTAIDNSDLTTYTFSSQNLGTADADRFIIVSVSSFYAGTGKTLDSVTVGGISATIVQQFEGSETNSTMAGMAVVNVPSGTTGDVVVTFSSGVTRCGIALHRTIGINATPSDSGSSGANDPTFDLDIPAGGFAVASCCQIRTSNDASWSGLTEDYDILVESSLQFTGASDDFATTQTGLTITCNFVLAVLESGVFVSWGEAAGDVAVNVDLVSGSLIINQPTVVAEGPVTVNANLVSGSLTINAPTVTAIKNVTVSVGLVTSSLIINAPTVASGTGVTVSPDVVTGTLEIFDPTITAIKNVTVSVGLLTSSMIIFAPTITLGAISDIGGISRFESPIEKRIIFKSRIEKNFRVESEIEKRLILKSKIR